MPYPPTYKPTTDFALTQQQGEEVDGTLLAVELANIAETLNQVRGFIKALATSDRHWQPASALAMTLADQATYTATAGQTAFAWPGAVTVSPSTAKARVFINGALLLPASMTIGATTVTIPAQTAGTVVVVELYDDEASVRSDLASTLVALGASLIGINDAFGFLAADDVEGALQEIMAQIVTIQAALGDTTGLIRADGTVPYTANQPMAGKRLTGAGNGVDPQDYVTLAQLSALSAVFSNLANIYLAKTGGAMSGNIDMSNNFLLNLKDGVQPKDGVNKSQLDAAVAAIVAAYLPLAGGTMTGEINLKANNKAIRVRQAVDSDEPVRLDQVDSVVAAAVADASLPWGGSGVLGSLPPDPGCPAPPVVIDKPGVWDFENLTISSPTTIPAGCVIRVRGNFVLSAALTINYASTAVGCVDPFNVGIAGVDWPGSPSSLGPWGGNGAGGRGGRGRGSVSGGVARPGEPIAKKSNLPWTHPALFLGGRGGNQNPAGSTWPGGEGGGAVIFLVDGDATLTGGSIVANGMTRSAATGGAVGGGGGAGTAALYCRGTVTDVDMSAIGGLCPGDQGGSFLFDGGGGGGGWVILVAKTLAGSINLSVKGGDTTGTGTSGGESGDGGRIDLVYEAYSTTDPPTITTNVTAGAVSGGGAPQGAAGVVETKVLLGTRFASAVLVPSRSI